MLLRHSSLSYIQSIAQDAKETEAMGIEVEEFEFGLLDKLI